MLIIHNFNMVILKMFYWRWFVTKMGKRRGWLYRWNVKIASNSLYLL